jgi:heme A synthase
MAALLALGAVRRPRRLAHAAAGAIAVLLPLCVVAQIWDPTWLSDYVQNAAGVRFQGPPLIARQAFGTAGPVIISLALAVVAVALGWRRRNQPVDLDTAALILALTVLVSNAGGFYTAIYALPAVARLGMRAGLGTVPWLLTAIPWLVVVIEAPALLGSSPKLTVEPLSLLAFALPLACLPLLRPARPSPKLRPI